MQLTRNFLWVVNVVRMMLKSIITSSCMLTVLSKTSNVITWSILIWSAKSLNSLQRFCWDSELINTSIPNCQWWGFMSRARFLETIWVAIELFLRAFFWLFNFDTHFCIRWSIFQKTRTNHQSLLLKKMDFGVWAKLLWRNKVEWGLLATILNFCCIWMFLLLPVQHKTKMP